MHSKERNFEKDIDATENQTQANHAKEYLFFALRRKNTYSSIAKKETWKKTLTQPRIEPELTTREGTALPIRPRRFDIKWRRISQFEFFESAWLSWLEE